MRIKKEQILFDAIQPKQGERISIGDESQDRAIFRAGPSYIRHYSQRGRPISAHAINSELRKVRRQDVSMQQLRISAMRPLLRAGMLLCHRLAESQFSSR